MLSLSRSACTQTHGGYVGQDCQNQPAFTQTDGSFAPLSLPPRPLPISAGLGENVPLASIRSVQCSSPALLPLLVEESDSNGVECLWREDTSTQQRKLTPQTSEQLNAAAVLFWRRLPPVWDLQCLNQSPLEKYMYAIRSNTSKQTYTALSINVMAFCYLDIVCGQEPLSKMLAKKNNTIMLLVELMLNAYGNMGKEQKNH